MNSNLPPEYNRPILENELRRLQQRIDDMKTLLTFIPVTDPVATPSLGMIMYSDGTSTTFGDHRGRGLYRYDYLDPDLNGDAGWIHFASDDMAPAIIDGANGESFNYTQSNDFALLKYNGGIGEYSVVLPSPIEQSYRTIRFISNDTVLANKKVRLDSGAFTIDGVTDYVIDRSYEGVTLFSDGANWLIIQAKK